jgi:hypothetical protein
MDKIVLNVESEASTHHQELILRVGLYLLKRVMKYEVRFVHTSV